ncbi:Uncharacterized conserved protein [Mycobacterium tuberculosis]|nr:Uncharacterized conserved protein [Mycobacterium tuberculosis]
MPAYVISEVTILDKDAVEEYKPLAKRSAVEFGGTYLARDVVPETLEGMFGAAERLVIIRFETAEDARRWYRSESYAKALAAAGGALDRRLFIVDGD